MRQFINILKKYIIKSWEFINRNRLNKFIGIVIVFLAIIFLNKLFFSGESINENLFFKAKRGNLLISLTEGGVLEAVNELVIKNELYGDSRIIYIVDEGKNVKKGDLIVELESSDAKNKLIEMEIDYENKLSIYLEAKSNVVISKSLAESDISEAKVRLKLAKLDLDKFTSIERDQLIRKADIDIKALQEEMKLSEEKLKWTKKLTKKGFETKSNLDQDNLNFLNKKLELEVSETQKKMLLDYDINKALTEYQSNYDESIANLERVKQRSESKIRQSISSKNSKEKTLELVKSKLEEMREQIKKTKIYAQQDGLIVYSKKKYHGSDSAIEEGAKVRNRQELVKIPDTSKLKAVIKVHESSIKQVKKGQKAFIVLDALPDRTFEGVVSMVAVLPDMKNAWSDEKLNIYTVEVTLNGKMKDLKPGISAQVQLIIKNLNGVLYVPIQAVTSYKGKQVCFVKSFRGNTPKKVKVGMFNKQFIEIKSGIEEGDSVLLSPPMDLKMDKPNFSKKKKKKKLKGNKNSNKKREEVKNKQKINVNNIPDGSDNSINNLK